MRHPPSLHILLSFAVAVVVQSAVIRRDTFVSLLRFHNRIHHSIHSLRHVKPPCCKLENTFPIILAKLNDFDEYDQEQMQKFLEDIEESNIDSFLRGDYDRPFAEDASAPHPGIIEPRQMLEIALKDLRALNDPELNHGAAVFLRFCLPLSRNERWGGGGGGGGGSNHSTISAWKEILRGALTPNMFAKRIEASRDYNILLHWQRMNINQDTSNINHRKKSKSNYFGSSSTTKLVNVQFYLEDRNDDDDDEEEEEDKLEPNKAIIIQFVIQKHNGVWLIEDAVRLSTLS